MQTMLIVFPLSPLVMRIDKDIKINNFIGSEKMKCETCQYCQQSSYEIKGKQVNMACCTLSNYVVKADKEHR